MYCSIQARDGAESLTLTLEHAIGSAREFTERGVASVRSLKSSTTTMSFSQNLLSHIQLEELRVALVHTHTHTHNIFQMV